MNCELQNNELMQEIRSLADSNDGHISYTIIADMLTIDGNLIEKKVLDRVIRELKEEGYFVDRESEDESYTDDTGRGGKNSFIPAEVNISNQSVSLDRLVDRIRYDEIDLAPDFQRAGGLWDAVKQSQLIESLMLRIPLPAFYFDASDDNKWVIIDGLQRLTAVNNIVIGMKNGDKHEFLPLTGLEYLTDFDGKKFPELPRQYQRRILEAQITVYVVQKSTPSEIVYNIFKRINTGGLNLTPQEIRHALYRGKATEAARELSGSEAFLRATDNTISRERMLDCEYVIRYFAFTMLDYERDYQDNIDNYLIQTMKVLNDCEDKTLKEKKNEFLDVMETAHAIFGRYTFRKIFKSGRRGPINKAIFEAWSHCLQRLTWEERQALVEKKELIVQRFKKMLKEENFSNWIKSGKKREICQRIDAVELMLEGVQNAPEDGNQ